MALLVQPIAAAVSDYTKTRWGRRKPYIFIGTLLDVLFLAGLAWSNTFLAVFAFVCPPVQPNRAGSFQATCRTRSGEPGGDRGPMGVCVTGNFRHRGSLPSPSPWRLPVARRGGYLS
jgi:hypothetical protein